jgi:DNA modification methylase
VTNFYEPFYRDPLVSGYKGDCLDILPTFPEKSVHCVVTSPPYWGLRLYKGNEARICGGKLNCPHEWKESPPRRPRKEADTKNKESKQATIHGSNYDALAGQFCRLCGAWRGAFGSEPTVELYIAHFLEVMRAVWRVLRDDGICWLNIGDSYASGKGTCYNPGGGADSFHGIRNKKRAGAYPLDRGNRSTLARSGLKPQERCLIPQRLMLALQADGWYIKQEIIWQKENPMPESVHGTYWTKHKVKIMKSERDPNKGNSGHPEGDSLHNLESAAKYEDCPGCPECAPNDGYILKRGSWRPTRSHEQILMLTKTERYYSDGEAVKEAQITPLNDKSNHTFGAKGGKYEQLENIRLYGGRDWEPSSNGRNLRSVWSFPTQGFGSEMCGCCGYIYEPASYRRLEKKEGKRVCKFCEARDWISHFAVFPEKLPRLCIEASTSEAGYCSKCGKPVVRILNKTSSAFNVRIRDSLKGVATEAEGYKATDSERANYEQYGNHPPEGEAQTVGWRPTCSCKAELVPGIVLDPFGGAGTTGRVAKQLGRRSILIDTSEQYCRIMAYQLEHEQPRLI